MTVHYAELHAHNAFAFAQGSAMPHDMVSTAKDLGITALAMLDIDGMYSAIQADIAGRSYGLPIVHGTELTLDAREWTVHPRGWGLPEGSEDPGLRLPILARNPEGYQDLCRTLSHYALENPGQRAYAHQMHSLAAHHRGNWLVLTGSGHGPLRRALAPWNNQDAAHSPKERGLRALDMLIDTFGAENIAVETQLRPTDPPELADLLADMAHARGLDVVATGGAYSSTPENCMYADIMTATRLRQPLSRIEQHLYAAGRALMSPEKMLHIHRHHPEAVDNAHRWGTELAFDLALLDPELPEARIPEGHTNTSWLRELTYRGAQEKYGSRIENPVAWQSIDKELNIIESLNFQGYFLIVKDIVDFCARQGIWCQGRGSAANSAVCFVLGITAVDAVKHRMMFERFLSQGRSGPPDIDIDIESDRREEVIQYVYRTYGRENAAQVGTVLTYRPRSAIYDVARALGYDQEQSRAWGREVSYWYWSGSDEESRPRVPQLVVDLAKELRHLPRHTGIHSGGMVLTRTPVSHICPIMWSATPGRSVIQWDKEDCADAHLVKFDLLGLGMLSALRRSFTWLEEAGKKSETSRPYGLHHLPEEDPRVYDLLCAADAIGVFQVESRAQLNTLPRMQPRCFYDLVIEVALIRPGPIQGQSVNPYLRRRRGEEEVTYPHELLRPALEKTLGVPLFQEQLMHIAVDIAGFDPAQADELRRAMGAKRSVERMEALRPRLVEGMAQRGITGDLAESIIHKLHAFADFGFPESHSFSFAFLVYASAWLKVHAPEFFYAGIIASQPMGFYTVSSLVHDARRHGVSVGRPDVNYSLESAYPRRKTADTNGVSGQNSGEDNEAMDKDCVDVDEILGLRRWHKNVHLCTQWEVRLGFDQIRGLRQSTAQRIVQARMDKPFTSINDCVLRCQLSADEAHLLAKSGAFDSLEANRRHALWLAGQVATRTHARVTGAAKDPASPSLPSEVQLTLPGLETIVTGVEFSHLTTTQTTQADYASMGVSTAGHPILSYATSYLQSDKGAHIRPIDDIGSKDAHSIVEIAGVITHRQSPATGKGVLFLSIEDASGLINVTCSVGMWKRYRQHLMSATVVHVRGMVEWGHGALNIVAHHIEVIANETTVSSRAHRGRGGW